MNNRKFLAEPFSKHKGGWAINVCGWYSCRKTPPDVSLGTMDRIQEISKIVVVITADRKGIWAEFFSVCHLFAVCWWSLEKIESGPVNGCWPRVVALAGACERLTHASMEHDVKRLVGWLVGWLVVSCIYPCVPQVGIPLATTNNYLKLLKNISVRKIEY